VLGIKVRLGNPQGALPLQSPVFGILSCAPYSLQGQAEKPVLWSIRRVHLVSNLDAMIAPRRLSELGCHVELTSQKRQLLFDALIFEP
jgi:hypothetical protein